jgi:hypothetical protein
MPIERDVDIRAKARQSDPEVVRDDAIVPVQATRDGALFSADWYLKQLLRGRIHQVSGGATDQGTTDPGTFGAGALDTDEFDLLITVPEGTVIIPLEWTVVLEKFGATGLLEIVLARGTGAVGSGTHLTLVPVNQNMSSNKVSALTNNVIALDNGGGTALTQEAEIWRGGLQLVEDIAADDAAAWPSRFQFKASSPADLHICRGATFIAGWVAGTACTGFQKFVYAEFESGEDIG